MFTISQTTGEAGVTLLRLQGRIAFGSSVQELEAKVDELVKAQAKRVVFDLSGVTFIDSTVVGTIVMCSTKLKNAGGSLRLAAAAGVVRQTLTLCRINLIIPSFATVEEAAGSFVSAQGSVA